MIWELVEVQKIFTVNSLTGEGIDELTEEIKRLYNFGEISQDNSVIVTNLRHVAALSNAASSVKRAEVAIKGGMPQDIAALDINEAISALGEITGDTVSEGIVTEIFHNFCVGK